MKKKLFENVGGNQFKVNEIDDESTLGVGHEPNTSPKLSDDEWNEKEFGRGADSQANIIKDFHRDLKDPSLTAMMMLQYSHFKENRSFLPMQMFSGTYKSAVQKISQAIQAGDYRKAFIIMMTFVA